MRLIGRGNTLAETPVNGWDGNGFHTMHLSLTKHHKGEEEVVRIQSSYYIKIMYVNPLLGKPLPSQSNNCPLNTLLIVNTTGDGCHNSAFWATGLSIQLNGNCIVQNK